MWLGTTRGDHLVVELAGQGQVGEAIAMHMAHLLAPVPVFRTAETVGQGFYARPRCDRFSNQLARSRHAH